MLAKQLIEHFETQTKLHVEIAAVAAKVRSLLPGQRFEFVPYEDEPDVLRGMLNQWECTLGWATEETIVNDVYYNSNMPIDWQRFVVCKELIHTLDPASFLTRTPSDVKTLIERMAIPLDLQLGSNGQEHADRLAEFQALAILLPRAARAILLPAYHSKQLSPQEVAQHAEIPVRYVEFLMSDDWDTRYYILKDFYAQTPPED